MRVSLKCQDKESCLPILERSLPEGRFPDVAVQNLGVARFNSQPLKKNWELAKKNYPQRRPRVMRPSERR